MQQPNDYALIIGVSGYPFYQKLEGPISDAKAFAGWLTDEEIGGGLPKQNCKLVLNPSPPIDGEIDDAVRLIEAKINRARKKGQEPRRFYLYFSGHGLSNQMEEINLLLNKWSIEGSRIGLSANGLWSRIATCTGFSEMAIFLDCCQNIMPTALGIASVCHNPAKNASKTQIFKAYSCRFLEKSFVAPPPAQPPATRYKAASYFTIALIEALEGAAADHPGGGVTQTALKAYVDREIPRRVKNQNPVVAPPPLEGTPFIFGSAPPQKRPDLPAGELVFAVTINFQPGHQGPVKLVLSNGDELPCPDWTRPWSLSLPKGLYELNDQSTPASTLPFRVSKDQNVTF